MSELGSALGIGIAFVGGARVVRVPVLPAARARVPQLHGRRDRRGHRRAPARLRPRPRVRRRLLARVRRLLRADRRRRGLRRPPRPQPRRRRAARLPRPPGRGRDQRPGPVARHPRDAHDGRRPRDGRGRRRQRRPSAASPDPAAAAPGYPRSFLFGLLFAAGWSPCIGPILGGILGLATATSSVAAGTVLLVAYAAGLAIPFLAVALGASWVSPRMTWVGRHHHAVSMVTGVLLVRPGRADAHQHARPAGDPRVALRSLRRSPDMTHEVNSRPLPPAATTAPGAAASPSAMDRVDRGAGRALALPLVDARRHGPDARDRHPRASPAPCSARSRPRRSATPRTRPTGSTASAPSTAAGPTSSTPCSCSTSSTRSCSGSWWRRSRSASSPAPSTGSRA